MLWNNLENRFNKMCNFCLQSKCEKNKVSKAGIFYTILHGVFRPMPSMLIFCTLLYVTAESLAQAPVTNIEITPSTDNPSLEIGENTLEQVDDLTKLSSFADSSDYQNMTLKEVIDLAVKHNRILKTYQLSVQSAKIDLKQAEYRFFTFCVYQFRTE